MLPPTQQKPSLADLLGGGPGAPSGGPPDTLNIPAQPGGPSPGDPGGAPGGDIPLPGDPAGGQTGQDYANPPEAMQGVIDAINAYLEMEQDQIDKSEATKLLQGAQALLAKDQKEKEAAAGVTPVHRGLSRITRQNQQQGGGPPPPPGAPGY